MDNKLSGKILVLFKSLEFQEPDSILGSISILNDHMNGLKHLPRVQLRSLYFTKRTDEYIKSIVHLSKSSTLDIFMNVERKELEAIIQETIGENALFCNYLDSDMVFLGKCKNLFECKSKDPLELVNGFYNDLQIKVNRLKEKRVNIIPLIKVQWSGNLN